MRLRGVLLVLLVLLHVIVQQVERLVVLITADAHIILLLGGVVEALAGQLVVLHTRPLSLDFIKLEEIVVHSSYYRVSMLEKYRMIRRIGMGSFGEVFQVSHKASGQLFAMKKIPNI